MGDGRGEEEEEEEEDAEDEKKEEEVEVDKSSLPLSEGPGESRARLSGVTNPSVRVIFLMNPGWWSGWLRRGRPGPPHQPRSHSLAR